MSNLDSHLISEIQLVKYQIKIISGEDIDTRDVMSEKGAEFTLNTLKSTYFMVCSYFNKTPNEKFMNQRDINMINSPYYGE